ncbi:thymidylate synthase [Acetivibrio clariflavus]|uniref:thymidylate synthase n=1 Tax=Acetivibrio clariflavus TaxID=288965 RepID=UPI000480BA85|nr:thymidylate synthase [Acetivibrio clariflavus]
MRNVIEQEFFSAASELEEYRGLEQKVQSVDIKEESVDRLVYKGILNIINSGVNIKSRAGEALQAYNTNYFLLNPRRRLHTLREKVAIRYLCRELLSYFKGSLKVWDGLAQASSFWEKLADEKGEINSNYGYYVFHQPIMNSQCKNQFEWVINVLIKNKDSRRGIININQVQHKKDTKDFPCTVSLLFFIRDDFLCCEVSSRSTDVITGLPYDIGFFSLLTELVFVELKRKRYQQLKLGYTMMKTSFTQVYLRTLSKAQEIIDTMRLNPNYEKLDMMPSITDSEKFLSDIYNLEMKTPLMKWIYEKAELV